MSLPPNLLDDLPAASADEAFSTLLSTPGIRVERIVSRGHASPEGFWYDQAWDEWVLVVAGGARLQFEGEDDSVVLWPGAYAHIPAGRRRRVEWTDPSQPTVWLAVHFPPAVGM